MQLNPFNTTIFSHWCMVHSGNAGIVLSKRLTVGFQEWKPMNCALLPWPSSVWFALHDLTNRRKAEKQERIHNDRSGVTFQKALLRTVPHCDIVRYSPPYLSMVVMILAKINTPRRCRWSDDRRHPISKGPQKSISPLSSSFGAIKNHSTHTHSHHTTNGKQAPWFSGEKGHH